VAKKYLTLFFLVFTVVLTGCEDPTSVDIKNSNNLPLWEEMRPEIPAGIGEKYYVSTSEIDGINWINQKIEELEFTLNEDKDGSFYIYPVTATQVTQYWDTKYNEAMWGCFVQYLKAGVNIREFTSAPISINNYQSVLDTKVAELRNNGFKIFSVDTQEIFTDEGTYVILYVYYYPSAVLNTEASTAASLVIQAIDSFSTPSERNTEDALYGLFNLLGHDNAKTFVPRLLAQVKARQSANLATQLKTSSRLKDKEIRSVKNN